MLSKIIQIFFIFFLFFFNISNADSSNLKDNFFFEGDVSNYFSALISYQNQENQKALKFFNSSKSLKEKHGKYIEKYTLSLVLNGEVAKAIKELELIKNKNNNNFFNAKLLFLIKSLKKENFLESKFYLNELKQFQDDGTIEFIITNILESYIYLFTNKSINQDNLHSFGNLSSITQVMQNCYLGNTKTSELFNNLIYSSDNDNSRYLFFNIHYLLSEKNFNEAQEKIQNIQLINSTLLVSQTAKWINDKKYKNFETIFSCKKSSDLIAEFFFLISNLFSTQKNFEKSNFYLNISNYLNPKFKFNLSLLAENYFDTENYKQCEKILNFFSEKYEIYYWYKVKKKARIILKKKNSEESFNYINSKFRLYKNPSIKILFDMGTISKNFKKYKISIDYFSNVISKLKKNSLEYAEVLYRRGGSFERIGKIAESDKDLLQSLEINPDNPYVLNYLAYAWLERNYKIDEAIEMLEKAYEQAENNPYIIDSIGWAYYLTGEYVKAEKLLKSAVEIMPTDPVVSDHYGSILWKLGRKIQANYFWKNVLTFEDVENELKEEIYHKLLNGLEKI